MNRAVVAFLAFAAGAVIPIVVQAAGSAETYRQLNLFGDVYERVKSDYVDEVTDEKLVEAAINGMLASLDPHSSYMNAKAFGDMQVQTRGEFGGLGIEVTMENGYVKVVTPIDDTPASRAGLKTGDYIIALDGKDVLGLTLQEAVEKMRGPVDSKIVISVKREGVTKPFDVTITRDVIRIRAVRSRREGNAIYVRVTQFNEQVDSGVKKAIADLTREIGADKVEGVILDLRNNPGGLLDQAVAISDEFLDRGEIVSTRGRQPDDVSRYSATRGDLAEGKPVIVLINGGSASASEIVAGALQDHHRAVIMGTRSFGKGSVQTIIPLPNQGALRLTTARYYTPSGRSIQAKGIEPDRLVTQPLPDGVNPDEAPEMRSEADLPNHLSAGDGEEDAGPRSAQSIPEDRSKDEQLNQALAVLKTLKVVDGKIAD